MTILSATTPIAAAVQKTPAASPTATATADPAIGQLFETDLARASKGAAAAPETAVAKSDVPEKSISFVSRGSRSGVMSPTQQFESFVLRTFIDGMLPQDNSTYFGTGTAGKIWKSMLAERIGDEMAKDGGIGIAEMLEKRGSKAEAVNGAQDKLKASDSMTTGAQAFKGLG